MCRPSRINDFNHETTKLEDENPELKWFVKYQSTDGSKYIIRSNDPESIIGDIEDLRAMENNPEYPDFKVLETNVSRYYHKFIYVS